MSITPALKRLIQALAVVFAASGQFLPGVAPRDIAMLGFAAGFAAALALGLVLWISALTKEQLPGRYRLLWLAVGAVLLLLALWQGARYREELGRLTFAGQEGRLTTHGIPEWQDTEVGRECRDEYEKGGKTTAIVRRRDWRVDTIWKEEALEEHRRILRWGYLRCVMPFVGAILCLAEAALVGRRVLPVAVPGKTLAEKGSR